MNALLLIAHGSSVDESNLEIARLTKKLQSSPSAYDLIDFAFLEIAKPTIQQSGADLAAAGASRIRILPYFLVAGNHVIRDVPREVATLIENYPDIKFSTAPYFGSNPGIADMLLAST